MDNNNVADALEQLSGDFFYDAFYKTPEFLNVKIGEAVDDIYKYLLSELNDWYEYVKDHYKDK